MSVEAPPPPFDNPYRPGAGHMPPHLAGREREREEFDRLLRQTPILENLVLTGLRGVGKTVLLDTFKPRAISAGWLWVGTDLSEAASVSDASLATRLLTDLSVVTSSLVVGETPGPGFSGPSQQVALTFRMLISIFEETPGLVADKLKAVLEIAADAVAREGKRGVIFAYDEAQNLADAADREQFPLSLLLDVFQSLQRKGVQFLLVLTGLPTLFPKLVEARTFAERMFRVVTLDKLDETSSEDAILKPLDAADCPVRFNDSSVRTVIVESGGYPYFIQFICREVYDVFIQQVETEGRLSSVPLEEITRKLDSDFFAGRWARATDRQRDLLLAIARLESSEGEFTVQEIVVSSREVLDKPFTGSHVSQMLTALQASGLIYKNRWGKYSFAVPLFDRFILRASEADAPQF